MPGCARLGDICTGHLEENEECYPPRENDQASENVFANGIGVHRVTDHWVEHCCGVDCHEAWLAVGSDNVMVNGLGCGRCEDEIDCNVMCIIATCSDNVIVN